MSTGKWVQEGVPHKGWSCVGIDDLGEPSAICEMCETTQIRYVHHMQHQDYPEYLAVGCICAENMSEDYEGPKRREKALKNAAARRANWLKRQWRTSLKGNDYLNVRDGFNVGVFPKGSGWSGWIKDIDTDTPVFLQGRYKTKDEAKLATFDAMIFWKEQASRQSVSEEVDEDEDEAEDDDELCITCGCALDDEERECGRDQCFACYCETHD